MLIGQLDTPEDTAPTPEEVAEVVQAAFGIKPDDAIWEDEEL